MGSVVGGAELAGPPTGQCLALIAAGEKGELLRIFGANFRQPRADDLQRLVPFDFLELPGPAFAGAPQRFRQPRRRIVLHDPGRSLAAQHAFVDRVILVALDIADLAVAQMDLDAAAAGTHVAGGGFGFVADFRRQVYTLFGVQKVAGHGV